MQVILILILNLNANFVGNIKFEQLLGKSLSEVEEITGGKFRESSHNSSKDIMYFNSEYLNIDFYGMTSNFLSVFTDKKNTVQSISIHFRQVINRSFYDSLVEKYGKPDHTYIRSNVKVISEEIYTSDDGFTSNLRKSEGDLREGTFDEKPLFIIWEKDDFYIQAFLRHKQNISEITFSIDSPPFNIEPSKKSKM